jgi:prevent-host-death family protein
MITETNAVAFRKNLGEMINQVQYRRDSIIINKDGKPVAVLIDAALFEKIRRMQARFDDLSSRFATAYSEVPMDQGLAEIGRAVSKARSGSAKKKTAGSGTGKG